MKKILFGKKYLDLESRELELTVPTHQAMVRVRACEVCGTNLNLLRDH